MLNSAPSRRGAAMTQYCSGTSLHISISLVDEWIRQDVPYLDLTTTILGVSENPAIARIILRQKAVVCGLAGAAAVYHRLGAAAEPTAAEGTIGSSGRE